MASHGSSIRAVAASAEGRLVATGGGGREAAIKVWDATSGTLLHTLDKHARGVTGLAFLPEEGGQRLVSVGLDRRVVEWDLSETPPAIAEWRVPAEDALITALAVHPLGSLLATGSKRVRVFRLDGSPEQVIEASEGMEVYGLAFDRTGKRLAMAGLGIRQAMKGARLDGPPVARQMPSRRSMEVRGESWMWDVASGEGRLLRRLNGFSLSVAYSPSGRLLAEAGGGVLLWEVEAGRLFGYLAPPNEDLGRTALAFGPGGRFLAATDRGDKDIVYDLLGLGFLDRPADLVRRVWERTGYGVLGTDAIQVAHPFQIDLRRAAAKRR